MTLKQRAADYFGASNTRSMTGVALGRNRYGFVSPTRIWIYDESGQNVGRNSTVINLTAKMHRELVLALDPNFEVWD